MAWTEKNTDKSFGFRAFHIPPSQGVLKITANLNSRERNMSIRIFLFLLLLVPGSTALAQSYIGDARRIDRRDDRAREAWARFAGVDEASVEAVVRCAHGSAD